LKDAFEGNAPEVKTYGGDNQVKISTKFLVENNDANTDSIVESRLYNGLKPVMGEDVSFADFIKDYRQSSRKVGPTIADDIKVAAVWSILFSLLIMFIYMFIRFKNWQFGLGAFAALVHDVLIVLGLFSIFGGILPFSLEIDQAFIAAILTVIGYSLNDTVVVFDRIREYIREHKRGDRKELYNSALNSTISRTFSTSLSTFFVLLAIFIFGGEVIRGFVFALLIGVVVGTYSSLFIATPVVFDTIKSQDAVKEEATKQYLGGKKKDKKKAGSLK
jgi:SecD/SecF fusion protein